MSRTKYIADQYAQIDNLLERMRQADIQSTPTDTQNDVQDVIEKDPAKGTFQTTDNRPVDVARQYRDNLALVNAGNPEMLARGVGKNAPPPVFEEKGADIHPGRQSQSRVGVRSGGTQQTARQPLQQPSEDLPGHMLYGSTGQIVDNATKDLEKLGQSSQHAPTRIQGGGSDGEVPAEQQYFDASNTQVAQNMVDERGNERTNVDFAYVEGESAYDKWLEENAGGAEIEGGEGAELSEKYKNELTATYVVDKPTNKA